MERLFTSMDHLQRATHVPTRIVNGIKEGTLLGHEELYPRCSLFLLAQQKCFETLVQQIFVQSSCCHASLYHWGYRETSDVVRFGTLFAEEDSLFTILSYEAPSIALHSWYHR